MWAGIATGYGSNGTGIESQWGARFPEPIPTGRGAHPVFYTIGTESFLGVKRPECDVVQPPTSSDEDKERIQLQFYPLMGLGCLF
jgi:hypothetical protein